MLSLSLAQKLKAAGLQWTPAENDFFAIPDCGFDDKAFVISDMTVLVDKMWGQLSVHFHGATEWALDHVMVTELVWLPSESQLRSSLEQHLLGEPEPAVILTSTADGYRCEIQFRGDPVSFEAFGASEAYGFALLHVLENEGEKE